MTTPRDIPPYGPHTPQNAQVRAIAEVQELEQKHAAEMAALRQKEAARQAAEQRREQAAKERAAARLAKLDEDLAPRRAELRSQFLMTNPTLTDADFQRYWQRVRTDEAEAHRERVIEAEVEHLRQSPRYHNIF